MPDIHSNHDDSHAIVIGGSVAGMLTARVLINHFARVTIIERDHLPEAATFRTGAPQARHAHALLVRGQEILEQFFPGLTEELLSRGATQINLGSDILISIGGKRVKSFDSSLDALGSSRPLLENAIFRRLRAMPGVQFLDQRETIGLSTDAEKRYVTGIRIQQRGTADRAIEELAADLVVDASGRSSKSPVWLQELGYAPPQEITVDAQAGYASRIYQSVPESLSWKAIYTIPQAPQQTRGCTVLPIEGNRWLVTLTGLNGDHPPTDEAGFMAFAKSVPADGFYEAITRAEPLTEPYGYRNGANRLRLFETMPRHLEGLLAVGDAVYALNPIYGQGMTVAAIGALTLDECLHKHHQTQSHPGAANYTGLARRFYKELAKVNAAPWQMATAQDMRWPVAAAEHKIDPVTKLMQRYFDRVLTTLVDNTEVAESFSYVQNMLKSPATLFHPRIMWQVLRTKQSPVAKPATVAAHDIHWPATTVEKTNSVQSA